MKEKILSSSKNIILVGVLIWIGLILWEINKNLDYQNRFKKAQLMCATHMTRVVNSDNKEDVKFEVLAESAAIPNKGIYLLNYCKRIEILSGSGY